MNDLLETTFQQEDDKNDSGYKFTLFVERFIPACLKSVAFVHKKGRMGVELFYDIVHLRKDVAKLKNPYQLMLTSLKDRSTVNNLLQNYSKNWEEESFKFCTSIMDGNVEVHKDFSFDNNDAEDNGNLKAWVEKKIV